MDKVKSSSGRKCRACGRTGHNTRTCSTLGRSKKTSVKNPGVGKGHGHRHCSKCGSLRHNARTCGTTRTARVSKDGKMLVRRNSSKRSKRNPEVAERLPVVGKTKTAKWFDGQMSGKAYGAQSFGSQTIPQKAITATGFVAGAPFGGMSTRIGQDMVENSILGSGIGIVTGLAGTTLSSTVVNKVFGEMLLSGHEKKHHTFANFTKGWRFGGYISVAANTVTNLLTMNYGKNMAGFGTWSGIMDEASHSPLSAVKKAVMKTCGADRVAHTSVLAQGMYDAGIDAPLQGQEVSHTHMTEDHHSQSGHSDDYSVGYVDTLGYPGSMGYPSSMEENQPLY